MSHKSCESHEENHHKPPMYAESPLESLASLHLITSYVRSFSDLLLGKVDLEAPAKLMGGARLHHIFHRTFAKAVLDFDAFAELSDMDIRVAMRNAAGPKPQLFVPEMAFERMVKRQIQKLEEPAMQCVSMVYEELKQLAAQSGNLQRFPSAL